MLHVRSRQGRPVTEHWPTSLAECAGSASTSNSAAKAPVESASASTAQQIQATGPAAVATVRAIQATAVATASAERQQEASGQESASGVVAQAVDEEPTSGPGQFCA